MAGSIEPRPGALSEGEALAARRSPLGPASSDHPLVGKAQHTFIDLGVLPWSCNHERALRRSSNHSRAVTGWKPVDTLVGMSAQSE